MKPQLKFFIGIIVILFVSHIIINVVYEKIRYGCLEEQRRCRNNIVQICFDGSWWNVRDCTSIGTFCSERPEDNFGYLNNADCVER